METQELNQSDSELEQFVLDVPQDVPQDEPYGDIKEEFQEVYQEVAQEHTGDTTEEELEETKDEMEVEESQVAEESESSMTSVDSQASDSEFSDYRVKPKEFTTHVAKLKEQFKALHKLIALQFDLEPNCIYEFPDGRVLETDDVSLIQKALLKRMTELNKYFSQSLAAKGKKGNKTEKKVGTTHTSLNYPEFACDGLVEFFNQANLGNAFVKNPTTGKWIDTEVRLQDMLTILFANSIGTRTGLCDLLTLYYRVNGLHQVVNGKKVVVADQALNEAFGAVFDILKVTPTAKATTMFNPEAFLDFDNTRILKYCVVDSDSVSGISKKLFDSIKSDMQQRTKYKNPVEREAFVGGATYRQFFEEQAILKDTCNKVKYDYDYKTSA